MTISHKRNWVTLDCPKCEKVTQRSPSMLADYECRICGSPLVMHRSKREDEQIKKAKADLAEFGL